MLLPCKDCPNRTTFAPREGVSYSGTRTCPPGRVCPINNATVSPGATVKNLKVRPTGPGTELKKILADFGFVARFSCQCNDHVRELDRRGVKWAEENMGIILGWLRDEWNVQRLPSEFDAGIAAMVVEAAIDAAKSK